MPAVLAEIRRYRLFSEQRGAAFNQYFGACSRCPLSWARRFCIIAPVVLPRLVMILRVFQRYFNSDQLTKHVSAARMRRLYAANLQLSDVAGEERQA